MSLTRTERWLLANQHRILEALTTDPDVKRSHSRAAEALERGYEDHYEWVSQQICDPVPDSQCREVGEILSMFEAIQLAYDSLKDTEGIASTFVEFPGFDGNTESHLLGYVRYFCDPAEHRFQTLRRPAHFNWNSHGSFLPQDRGMLALYRSFGSPANLSREQLDALTGFRLPDRP